MTKEKSLQREEKATDLRVLYGAAAAALATAQTGLLESREALTLLGQNRAADRLVSFVAYVGEIRRLLQEKFAETAGNSEADKLFTIPSSSKPGGRTKI